MSSKCPFSSAAFLLKVCIDIKENGTITCTSFISFCRVQWFCGLRTLERFLCDCWQLQQQKECLLTIVSSCFCSVLIASTLVYNYLKHFSLLAFLLLAQIFFLVLHSIRLKLLCAHWSVKFLLTSYWLSDTRVMFLSKRQLTVNPILSLPYFHPNTCNLFFRICTQLLYFLFLWA